MADDPWNEFRGSNPCFLGRHGLRLKRSRHVNEIAETFHSSASLGRIADCSGKPRSPKAEGLRDLRRILAGEARESGNRVEAAPRQNGGNGRGAG